MRHVLAVALTLMALAMSPALAHEENRAVPARDLIQQAIALLRSQPQETAAIADKIRDALASKDTSAVDLALLRKALDVTDRHEKEDLLERAIGLTPHRLVTEPASRPRARASPGPAAPAHAIHVTAYKGGLRSPDSQGVVLIGVAILLAAAGWLIARRHVI